jgi:hypothetical protein
MIGYKPRDKGLGVINKLKDLTGLNKTTWPVIAKIFACYPTLARLSKYPVAGPIFKWAMMFSPWDKRFTQGVSLPLNTEARTVACLHRQFDFPVSQTAPRATGFDSI